VRYQAKNWYVQAGYFASIYDTKAAFLRWDNPFTAMVAGADVGQMAMAPTTSTTRSGCRPAGSACPATPP